LAMANVIVRAYSRAPEWDGPMRGWLDNRVRTLRDDPAVRAVVIFEGEADDGRPYWELGIRIADYPQAMDPVKHLIEALELLEARPELITEVERPDLRSSA
jgi:hypothetical protein